MWDFSFGWGVITAIDLDAPYPLGVQFTRATVDNLFERYSRTGVGVAGGSPTLFPNEFAIPNSAYKSPLSREVL